jgi:cyclophilin family peptidyl-prolyl cis-trans isomerase
MAEKLGYKIIYVVFEPDKQDIKKLAQRNLHGVDAAKLEIMAKKFRPPSGEKGKIKSGKPLHFKGTKFHRIITDFMA